MLAQETMSVFVKRLKFAWDYFVRGRHSLPPFNNPPDLGYPEVDEGLMDFLVGMYQAHGAEAVRVGSWVVIDRGRLFTRAAYFDVRKHPAKLILQTDFVTVPDSGQHIVESFAGVGTDLPTALQDACKSFQDSSFHVLFSALLAQPCGHVEQEVWSISGVPRRVTLGLLRMRGHLPLDQWPPVFEALQKQVQSFAIPSGLHWIRFFYSSFPIESPTIEVLVNNDTCSGLQMQAAELPWPRTKDVYTARLFFIIQDA